MPDKISLALDSKRLEKLFLRSINVFDKMLAINKSILILGIKSGFTISIRSITLLFIEFSFVALSACGSISEAIVYFAPRSNEAIERIPLPQP